MTKTCKNPHSFGMARKPKESKASCSTNLLTIQDGFVFKEDRLIIQRTMRKQMLEEIQIAHQGLESIIRREKLFTGLTETKN